MEGSPGDRAPFPACPGLWGTHSLAPARPGKHGEILLRLNRGYNTLVAAPLFLFPALKSQGASPSRSALAGTESFEFCPSWGQLFTGRKGGEGRITVSQNWKIWGHLGLQQESVNAAVGCRASASQRLHLRGGY